MNLSKEEYQRYSRHLLMDEFGLQGQLKLKQARVLVVGAGGLGCPCLLYLAAAGLGTLGIADDDVIDISNLQRQVIFNAGDVGLPKAECAKAHILAKNPLLNIHTYGRITVDNVLHIASQYDLIIDGSDNFSTRYLLNDACVILNKPYIYGALFKFEGQVSTFNYQDGPTYRCLYPEAPPPGEVKGCGEAGVLGVLPGIIGTWQATEAIKVITGIGEILSGRLLIVNLLSNRFDVFSFKANKKYKHIEMLGNYDEACVLDPQSITYQTLNGWLQKDENLQLIDVREEFEFESYNIGGLNIPLDELEDKIAMIHPANKIVVICQSGTRSAKAMQLIKTFLPQAEIYHVKQGFQEM